MTITGKALPSGRFVIALTWKLPNEASIAEAFRATEDSFPDRERIMAN
jgi:hypothetical protein